MRCVRGMLRSGSSTHDQRKQCVSIVQQCVVKIEKNPTHDQALALMIARSP